MINGTKILTPNGFKRIDNILIGDTIINGTGHHVKITAMEWGIAREVCEIEIADGRKIHCSPNDVIRYFTRKTKWRNTTLDKIIPHYERNPDYPASLPCFIPCNRFDTLNDNMYDIIHPFNLGVLLGDGSLGKLQSHVAHYDLAIRDEVIRNLPEGNSYNKEPKGYDSDLPRLKGECGVLIIHQGATTKKLKEWGLIGKKSWEKFIPKGIKGWEHAAWRMELLRGLLTTDGSIHTTASYSTTSKQLAIDVKYLVRSLGGIANIRKLAPKENTIKGKTFTSRLCYIVNIRYKDYSELAFKPFHVESIKRAEAKLAKDRANLKTSPRNRRNFKFTIKSLNVFPYEGTTCVIETDDATGTCVCDDFIVIGCKDINGG